MFSKYLTIYVLKDADNIEDSMITDDEFEGIQKWRLWYNLKTCLHNEALVPAYIVDVLEVLCNCQLLNNHCTS